MNGTVFVEVPRPGYAARMLGMMQPGVVNVHTDAEGNLWVSGYKCGDGLVPVTSVEAAKGWQMVIITTAGKTISPGKVTGIRCTSKTIGEYDANGFWAGPS